MCRARLTKKKCMKVSVIVQMLILILMKNYNSSLTVSIPRQKKIKKKKPTKNTFLFYRKKSYSQHSSITNEFHSIIYLI